MIQTVTIPAQLPSRNDADNASRSHWSVGRKFKKDWTEYVAWFFKDIPAVSGVAHVSVIFYEPNNRRDDDNVMSSLKYIMDGMQKSGVIKNDSRKHCIIENCKVELDRNNAHVDVEIRSKRK